MEQLDRPHHIAHQQTLIVDATQALLADDLDKAESLLDQAARAGRIQRGILESRA